MPRPEPSLLDPRRYPHLSELSTRYSDLDPLRHLNNTAIATLIDDARVRFTLEQGFRELIGTGRVAMIISTSVDFMGQGQYPAPVLAYAGVESVGRTSWNIVQFLTQDGRQLAFSRSVAVCIEAGRAVPLAEGFRECLLHVLVRDSD